MLKHASRASARISKGFLGHALAAAMLAVPLWAPASDALARSAKADEHFSRDIDAAATERLFRAVEKNDLAGAQKAVAEGGDLAATNAAGRTPADIAVDKGFYPIAQFLLQVRNFQEKDKSHKPPNEVVQELTKDQPKPKAAAGPVPLQRGRALPATPPSVTAAPPSPSMAATPPGLPPLPADKPKPDDRPRSRYFAGLSSFDPTPRTVPAVPETATPVTASRPA